MTNASIITHDERVHYREALKDLDMLILRADESMRGIVGLSDLEKTILERMTDTTDARGQLRALHDLQGSLDQQYDDALKFASPEHFSHFCEYMFRDEPPALHHEFLIEYMEKIESGEIMRLGISMPPGAAKSSYASIRFAAWYLGKRPNDRWLQGAHTMTFAKDRLGKPVRNLILEKRYKDVFPEMGLSASSSAADYFEFTAGRGYYKAVGVGTGIAGYRFEIGAIDDPIASREDAESPTSRRKLHNWYEDDFGTRPSNPRAPIFVVNTRWHEDDLVGHELQKMADGNGDDWTIINIPAIAEEDDALGREYGEALWPEHFGLEFYMHKKRTLTGRSWNSLYQGSPTDEEGGVLKREDVSRYTNIPADVYSKDGSISKKIVKKITLSLDCAEKATERSDYTAATVWLETVDKKHYLVHAARIKKEFGEMVQWAESIAKTWKVDSMMIEDRGAGTQYIQVRKTSPGAAPVIPISTKQQSKVFRFDGITPMFKAGEVFLPEKGTDWIADVERELFAFPNGRNDDYVDSVGQYLAEARGNNVRRGTAKINSGFR